MSDAYALCLFCGNPDEPGHVCDGRQGAVEAELALDDEVVLRARHSDPETSQASMAAVSLEQLRAAADVAARLHRTRGPLADFEYHAYWLAAWPTPCSPHLYRQARSVARDKGWIRDSGQRKRNPETNRQQVVWEACAEDAPVLEKCAACGHLLRRRKDEQDAIV